MFVILCVHAIITVMLAALRTDTGLLKSSDQRLRASLRAHSATLYALEQLESADGLTWEEDHTLTERPNLTEPPAEADQLDTVLEDGSSLSARAWVEETEDPKVRTVWGASFDGTRWHFSTAVAIRREVNPGLLFGIQLTGLQDEVYFQSVDSDEGWQQAPLLGNPTTTVFDSAADSRGHLYVLESQRVAPLSGKDLSVNMLDTSLGAHGEWKSLPALPPKFMVDKSGLAVGKNHLYVAGLSLVGPAIIQLPVSEQGLATGPWAPLGKLPQATIVEGDGQVTKPPLPFQFTDLKASPDGDLYVHLQVERGTDGNEPVTTFARYRDGEWSFFPKPQAISGVTRRGLLPLDLDDLGNPITFGRPVDEGAGQLYRFAANGEVKGEIVQGHWKPIPRDTALPQNIEQNIRAVTVDSQGNMFLGAKTEQGGRFAFQEVYEVPLRGSQEKTVRKLDFPDSSLNHLEAGGQGPTGEIQYVPVSWY
jgi:hypothetical protein